MSTNSAAVRISPERAEDIIEEIATVMRDWASDERGLELVTLGLLRPDGRRTHIPYGPVERGEEWD